MPPKADEGKPKAINVNIGVLGHIDSGKTSLCRTLSTVTSTASMDKAPASQERGITLDLGFSSFSADAPENFKAEGVDVIQFCLVDCPGHASLIRTVIGGAQIIDLCMLVIDANKGIQAQTAECLVVAEILANQLVIVLNKIDMIPANKRAKMLPKIMDRLRAVFAQTKFGADVPFACTAASPQDGSESLGVIDLVEMLKAKADVPRRDLNGPFMFSFDHAFPIRGQGTVLTGTVLSGSVKPAQIVDLPAIGEAGKAKKVRSIQMFKQPVQLAGQGDRAAICVTNLDAKELERGLMIDTKLEMPVMDAAIVCVNRLGYFKSDVKTKAKFHVSLGHQTVMAQCHFFCPMLDAAAAPAGAAAAAAAAPARGREGGGQIKLGTGALVAERSKQWPSTFDFSKVHLHLDELFQHGAPVNYDNSDGNTVLLAQGKEPGKIDFSLDGVFKREVTALRYDRNTGRLADHENNPFGVTVDSVGVIPLKDRDRVIYLLSWLAQCCMVPGLPEMEEEPLAYALMVFEKPVQVPLGSLLIGSKLDFETHSPNCRLAFFGKLLNKMDPKNLKAVRLLKMKSKTGLLDRFDKQDSTVVICKDMFKPDTDMSLFFGLKVVHENSGMVGVLEGAFAQEGKFRVRFPEELKVRVDPKGNIKGDERITIFFKKFNFDEHSRKFVQ